MQHREGLEPYHARCSGSKPLQSVNIPSLGFLLLLRSCLLPWQMSNTFREDTDDILMAGNSMSLHSHRDLIYL